MKTSKLLLAPAALLLAFILHTPSFIPTAGAQTTAFTYQGFLTENGGPASGQYDFTFTGYFVASGGLAFVGPVTNANVGVTNGLFTAIVDLGPSWTPNPTWLEIATRPAGGTNDFTVLGPRHRVTSAPLASYAAQAGTVTGVINESYLPPSAVRDYVNETITGFYTFDSLPGNPPFSVNSTVLVTNLNSDRLDGLDSSAFWKVGGNAGTTPGAHFLGTTDNVPMEFRVNGQRALRIEYPTAGSVPNLVGGFSGNSVGAGTEGAVIAGGGASGTANSIGLNSDYSAIGGGRDNDLGVDLYYGVIGGGYNNNIASDSISATIAGGYFNDIGVNSDYSTIGGGQNNNIASNSWFATIAGGVVNDIGVDSDHSTIGGGFGNNIADNALYAVIPGGHLNAVGAGGTSAFAAGYRAKANHSGAFVWADSQNADFASTGTNQFCIRATGGVRLDNATSLSFGNATRQMLNLYNADYAIGIQSYTLYFRADAGGGGFAWHKGGSHSDAQNDPGAGGTTLMRLDSSGNLLTAGAVNPPSDRNVKKNFRPVDGREVLAKVVALPITRWNYKTSSAEDHVGPVAQDFHAAFGLGTDDKHIATVDADGVALAAIQGLNQKVDTETATLRAENAALKQRNSEMEARLNALEKLIKRLSVTQNGGDK